VYLIYSEQYSFEYTELIVYLISLTSVACKNLLSNKENLVRMPCTLVVWYFTTFQFYVYCIVANLNSIRDQS
jgi:hypothetical protein